MRFLHDTHFQFMKYRKFWIAVSTFLNLASIGLILFGPGFKYGVDFAGGTQVTLKFKSEPDQARVRKALEDLKLGAVNIQRFDEAERHELLVRVQNPGEEGDFSAQMLAALDKEFNPAGGRIRMNLQGMEALRDALVEAEPAAHRCDQPRRRGQPAGRRERQEEAEVALQRERARAHCERQEGDPAGDHRIPKPNVNQGRVS